MQAEQVFGLVGINRFKRKVVRIFKIRYDESDRVYLDDSPAPIPIDKARELYAELRKSGYRPMTYKDYENDKTVIDENDWWYSASGRQYKPGYEVTEERYDLCDLYNSFSDLDCETVEYEKTDSNDT